MAVYDDFDGVYFSVQALRMYHTKAMRECEIVVVDNHPDSPDGRMTAGYVASLGNLPCPVRYVPYAEATGTSAPRDHIFRVANSEAVMCMDSHVFLDPQSLDRLLNYYFRNQHTRDLLSGPMLYDNLQGVSTHFADEWRSEMWGTWGVIRSAKDRPH